VQTRTIHIVAQKLQSAIKQLCQTRC